MKCECKKEKYRIVIHNCTLSYNGTTPFLVIGVMDKAYNLIPPSSCTGDLEVFNSVYGYAGNYYSQNFVELDSITLLKSDSVPIIADTLALLLVYNSTN